MFEDFDVDQLLDALDDVGGSRRRPGQGSRKPLRRGREKWMPKQTSGPEFRGVGVRIDGTPQLRKVQIHRYIHIYIHKNIYIYLCVLISVFFDHDGIFFFSFFFSWVVL